MKLSGNFDSSMKMLYAKNGFDWTWFGPGRFDWIKISSCLLTYLFIKCFGSIILIFNMIGWLFEEIRMQNGILEWPRLTWNTSQRLQTAGGCLIGLLDACWTGFVFLLLLFYLVWLLELGNFGNPLLTWNTSQRLQTAGGCLLGLLDACWTDFVFLLLLVWFVINNNLWLWCLHHWSPFFFWLYLLLSSTFFINFLCLVLYCNVNSINPSILQFTGLLIQ